MDRDAMEELKRMQTGGSRMQLTLLPHEALMLIDLVQVGSVNAACEGPAKEFGQRVVATITGFFGERTAIGKVIASGWKM